jgi:type I restriction enzyme R subunit
LGEVRRAGTLTYIVEGVVEEACLDYLRHLDYQILYGPTIAPGEPASERMSYADVVLWGRLRSAMARVNPDLPPPVIDEAVARVRRAETQSLIAENWRFHRLVTDGVPVEYRAPSGQIVYENARLIDFEDLGNNDWLAVNQFTVIQGPNHRRPDVVIFVNGLPLALIELKNPGDEDATIDGAFNQIQTYKAEIPSIFEPNAVCVVSDGIGARMGSITAGKEHFAPWKTVEGDDVASTALPQLEVLTRGAFNRPVFLDLVRNFIAYSDENDGLVKRLAKYHQYWAVNRAVESTVEASTVGDGRAGVVWHTQGSGKSLEMIFYAAKAMRHPAMNNPTLVFITDRNDLDDQLFSEVFAPTRTLPETPVQAESREHLRDLLSARASGGIIFTTVQKFARAKGETSYPLLSDRRNIVVIADEAHRSQYDFIDGFARHLRDGLPNATFIGFTGTPVEFDDRSTRQVFGEYISVYDLTQAVEDEATVPIFYDARLVKVDLPESEWAEIDEEFERVTEAEEGPVREKLKSRWARVEAVVGSEDRIKTIAGDIVKHWETRREVLRGKGMIVGMSRRICAALYREIVALRPSWHSDDDELGSIKVIYTGSAADPPELRPHIRNKERLRKLKARAKEPDDRLELIIVRDMWLTGFDSPALHTMYVDKPMRGHGLMQAIARVNRTFRDKPGGLIVDYLGLADALRKALADYTERDREDLKAGIPIDLAVGQMTERYEIVQNILHGHDWSGAFSEKPAERLASLAAAVDYVLGDPERKKRFMDQTLALSKAFALAVPDARALAIRDPVGLFQAVRAQIAKLDIAGVEGGRSRADVETAIAQIVSEAVASQGVVDIYQMAGVSKPDLTILSDEFLEEMKRSPRVNLQMEVLKKLLNDQIHALARKNRVEYEKFSEKLNRAILSYQNKSLTSAQVVAQLVELARDMRKAHHRGEDLGLTEPEVAFYDAVADHETAREVLGDDTLKQIARDLVETVKKNVTVDWSIKESARANMRRIVRRLLARYGYPPDQQEAAVVLVLQQAELLAAQFAAA